MNQAPTIFRNVGSIKIPLGLINGHLGIYFLGETVKGHTYENYLFTDSDGDVLSYTVSSANANIVEGSIVEIVSNDRTEINLNYHPIKVGTTTITLTATDGKGGSVSMIIEVEVL